METPPQSLICYQFSFFDDSAPTGCRVPIGTCQEQTRRYITHTTTNTQPTFALFLWKTRQNSNKVKICHDWFRIDYFSLNLHLIIEILVHICWRSEFIIARPLCWKITRNNSVNYFEFCPVFDKDCLHFPKCDASVPPLWAVPVKTQNLVMLPPHFLLSWSTFWNYRLTTWFLFNFFFFGGGGETLTFYSWGHTW